MHQMYLFLTFLPVKHHPLFNDSILSRLPEFMFQACSSQEGPNETLQSIYLCFTDTRKNLNLYPPNQIGETRNQEWEKNPLSEAEE